MRFEPLEDAGTLLIDYDGPPPDLYSLGILQLTIQEIVDKVSYAMWGQGHIDFPLQYRRRTRWVYQYPLYGRMGPPQLRSISAGSLRRKLAS